MFPTAGLPNTARGLGFRVSGVPVVGTSGQFVETSNPKGSMPDSLEIEHPRAPDLEP